MKLTLAIDSADRTVLMRELHSLVAGDLYDPIVLDFSSAPPAALAQIDDSSLHMTLRRDGPAGAEIASVPSFSRVPGHRCLRASTLSFATSALSAWWSEARPGANPRARAACWLEVSDDLFTYVVCEIPVVLRDFAVRDGQDAAGYYTAAHVDSLVASLRLTLDDAPSAGSANPVESGGVHAALSAKADASAVAAALAGKADGSAVEAALAAKADASAVAAALAGKADGPAVEGGLAGKADKSSVAAALALKADASGVQATAERAAQAAVQSAGLVTSQTLAAELSSRTTRTELETALRAKADAADIPDVAGLVTQAQLAAALAGKADAADADVSGFVTTSRMDAALAEKADAAGVSDALESKAGISEMDAALALKADASDMSAALSGKADAADIPDVSGLATAEQLALKASSSDVYTKSEVDSLVASPGQVPLRAEASAAVYVQWNGAQTPIASVRSVERDSVGVLAVELVLAPSAPAGLREAFPGIVRLTRPGSFSQAGLSSDSERASVSWEYDELAFALGAGSWSAAFAPSPDFGGPRVSEVVDESPSERPAGAAPRLATSAGVKAALDVKLDASVHEADLAETRLITARNATTAARATAAAARNLSLILDLEARFDGVDPEEVG